MPNKSKSRTPSKVKLPVGKTGNAPATQFPQEFSKSLPAAIYRWDITETDPEWIAVAPLEELGYSATEIRAAGIKFLREHLHPEDEMSILSDCRDFFVRDTTGDFGKYTCACRIKRADGSYRWFAATTTLHRRTSDGKPLELLTVMLDLNQHDAALKPLKMLLRTDRRNDIASRLTEREREVLRFIYQGWTTIEIAGHLFISQHTVRTHRKNLHKKLGLRNTAELVRFATENGLT